MHLVCELARRSNAQTGGSKERSVDLLPRTPITAAPRFGRRKLLHLWLALGQDNGCST